ncbi:MAG: CbbQ/NirQ/NorQ/GpvN family protein [Deltaproteobacteria bacterium]|nr:CbbQ/NirQ/NorQ/GpvN family protein [Deltaproteobacteria bacterium]
MVYYKNIKNEEVVFRAASSSLMPVLLKGPTGCGKTRFIQAMAEKLNRPLITVACNDETSAVDLIGRYIVKGGDTIWQEGPVSQAVRQGAILYLDEIAEAREDVITVLHPLGDHRRELFIDRHAEIIQAPREFMLVASFNPGYQKSMKELKPSIRQRFVTMLFDYPESEIEQEIICHESSCDPAIAKKLVTLANKIRKLEELGLTETVSTRLLVHAAKLIQGDLGPRQSCDVAITQAITDDQDTSQALTDLISMVF